MQCLGVLSFVSLLIIATAYELTMTDLLLQLFVQKYSAEAQYNQYCKSTTAAGSSSSSSSASSTTSPSFVVRNRIVGGNLARAKQIPYQAGLRVSIGSKMIQCGGILISERHLLTAAHCVDGADAATVYLGAIVYGTEKLSAITVNVTSKNIRVHESYDPINLNDDIALITFPRNITTSDLVRPIPLACPYITDKVMLRDGGSVTASGWGKISDAATAGSTVLYYAQLPVLSARQCMCYYETGVVNEQTHICTSTGMGKNVCNGDSGGPLVYLDHGVEVAVGIASFVYERCQTTGPSGFTRISNYLEWIHENTENFNPWWGCYNPRFL